MKKLVILCSLIFVFICSPLAAIEDKRTGGEAIDKLQKEQVDVYLEHYGVKHISENGSHQSIKLYKIIIGDMQKLMSAKSLNKSNGFDGLIFTSNQDNKGEWDKIIVHRSVNTRKGWKVSRTVKKDMLPYPFNTMTDGLLNKIHFFNVYPDNDNVAVVYIVEGTRFSDCKKIFDYICQKKKQTPKAAGI